MARTYNPIPKLTPQEIERFFSYIDRTPGQGPQGTCHLWKGGKTSRGYGNVKIRGVMYGSHRVAFFIHNGSIDDSLLVRHTCDIEPCENPEHLLQGTEQDNADDRVARNRMAKGSRHGSHTHPESRMRGEQVKQSKLNRKIVREIRKIRADRGLSYQKIADHILTKYQIKIDQSLVALIVKRVWWKHVE